MRRTLFLPLIVLAVFLISFVPDSWLIYTSDMGHYAISFPGNPSQHSETDTAENNIPFTIHSMSYSDGDTLIYVLGWIDMTKFYPKEKDITQMLEDAQKGSLNSMQATNVTNVTTTLGASPYIESTFRSNGYTGKERIYIIHKFQYSVIALGPPGGITPDMQRFLSSFQYMY